jgi:hypothetical protein
MAQFPSLVPSQAPITPGNWPMATHRAMDGGRTNVRTGSVEIGRAWAPQFENITEADYLAILGHYRAHRTRFDRFDFSTASLAAALTPSGYSWRWAEAPQVVDQHADVFTVSCSFICVPRRMPVITRKAWRTSATTLTRGAWAPNLGALDVGVRFASAATTLTRGAWFGARAFLDGIPWVSSATTLARGAWSVAGSDPDFASVVLLTGFNGTNGSTTFVDEGPLGLTLTAKGGAQISTAQSVFGGSSLSIAGSGSVGLPTNSALVLSGDFTLDARCRFNQSKKDMILGSRTGTNFQLARESGAGLGAYNGTVATASFTTGTGTWYALRWARSGSTLYFFADGTLLSSATVSGSFDFSGGDIGQLFGAVVLDGFIDELRLTTVCRSTTSYTVDTAPFPRS